MRVHVLQLSIEPNTGRRDGGERVTLHVFMRACACAHARVCVYWWWCARCAHVESVGGVRERGGCRRCALLVAQNRTLGGLAWHGEVGGVRCGPR